MSDARRAFFSIRPLTILLATAVVALALLAFQAGDSAPSAVAYPGLTVGLDANPLTTTDTNGDGEFESVVLSQYEDCRDVALGASFEIDLLVLDVLDLVAFSADIEYDPAILNVIAVDTNLFLGAQTGSNVFDVSQGVPSSSGIYETGAFDQSNQGDDGSGVLSTITFLAISNGTSDVTVYDDPPSFSGTLLKDTGNNPMGDTDADTWYDGPYLNETVTVAVGGTGLDSDLDGVSNDCDNCPTTPNAGQTNTDGDQWGDACDFDDDNDGVGDGPDNCNLVYNPSQADWNSDGQGDACDDSDGDGAMDATDNCRSTSNANQADMDSDGIGDVCDSDRDGDGLDNGADNCPDASNPGQEDSDSNGIGDACQDLDGDGFIDIADNCPNNPNPQQTDDDADNVGNPCDNCLFTSNAGQENNDGDALGDVCDPDDDNDSIGDGSDNCQLIANGPSQNGIPGVGNQSDADSDGVGDPCDLDADADGFPKSVEEDWGSKDWLASSTPEVCDGADNDDDGQTDEGYGTPLTTFADQDGDTVVDCVDPNVDTDGDGIMNPTDTDDDGDGVRDVDEGKIVTDSLQGCDDGSGYDDWPPDFDANKVINVTDVFQVLPPVFGTSIGQPSFNKRADIHPNGVINSIDVFRVLPPVLGSGCS